MKKLCASYHRYTNKRVKTSVINFITNRETQSCVLNHSVTEIHKEHTAATKDMELLRMGDVEWGGCEE